eukprot:11148184-Heterocapsa_arctica.AAC.1
MFDTGRRYYDEHFAQPAVHMWCSLVLTLSKMLETMKKAKDKVLNVEVLYDLSILKQHVSDMTSLEQLEDAIHVCRVTIVYNDEQARITMSTSRAMEEVATATLRLLVFVGGCFLFGPRACPPPRWRS